VRRFIHSQTITGILARSCWFVAFITVLSCSRSAAIRLKNGISLSIGKISHDYYFSSTNDSCKATIKVSIAAVVIVKGGRFNRFLLLAPPVKCVFQ
jgi:hypothetical protein